MWGPGMGPRCPPGLDLEGHVLEQRRGIEMSDSRRRGAACPHRTITIIQTLAVVW